MYQELKKRTWHIFTSPLIWREIWTNSIDYIWNAACWKSSKHLEKSSPGGRDWNWIPFGPILLIAMRRPSPLWSMVVVTSCWAFPSASLNSLVSEKKTKLSLLYIGISWDHGDSMRYRMQRSAESFKQLIHCRFLLINKPPESVFHKAWIWKKKCKRF